MMMQLGLTIGLLVSIGINVFLALKSRALLKKPVETQDAKELLHYLTRYGTSIVQITLIDPGAILLRSPR